MSCRGYDRYQAGRWSGEEFERHAAVCPDCRRARDEERAWARAAAPLRDRRIEMPGLWDRIEEGLRREMAAEREAPRGSRAAVRPFPWRLVPVAALALVGIMAGIFLLMRLVPTAGASGLLDEKALAKVERRESEYIAAIRELEAGAVARLAGWDQEARLLYRDKLETIDRQVERCRAALEVNPGNAHIRQFLSAALQDKRETLARILDLDPGGPRPPANVAPGPGPKQNQIRRSQGE